MQHITYRPIDRQFRCLERDLPPGAPFNRTDPIAGITFGFALETRFPEEVYFGTVDEAVADDPAIELRAVSQAEYDAAEAAEMAARRKPSPELAVLVEAEKVRRIEAGFPFMGKVIQSRAEDRENIAGAKSAAQDAKLLGAEPGELSWQKRLDAEKGADVFAWITLDNSMLPLDADAMIAMGYAAMLHKQRLIFVAKGIKDRLAAGEEIADVTADALWS